MKKHIIASFVSVLLSCGTAFAADSGGVLNDSDMPALRDAMQKSYTLDLCRKDIPNASPQTCTCLGQAMSANLNTDKLKLCKKEGYDDCVAAEFSAAKSNLSDKQINDCKTVVASGAAAPVPASDAQAAKAEDDSAKSESTDETATDK